MTFQEAFTKHKKIVLCFFPLAQRARGGVGMTLKDWRMHNVPDPVCTRIATRFSAVWHRQGNQNQIGGVSMIDMTMKEYEAIVYAYARLDFIVQNDKRPEYIESTLKSDQSCVNVLDKFLDRVKEIIEKEAKED